MQLDRTRTATRSTGRAASLAVAGLLVAAVAAPAVVSAAPPDRGATVTICQATNSNSNPYVRITVAASSILNPGQGHGGVTDGPVWDPTLKDQKIKWGDIVPPFSVGDASFDGHNWNEAGQAIFDGGCGIPAGPEGPSTEPSTEPSSEPSSSPDGGSLPDTGSPSDDPGNGVLDETDAPAFSLPPTDTLAAEGGTSPAGSLHLVLAALAGVLAAVGLTARTPARRQR